MALAFVLAGCGSSPGAPAAPPGPPPPTLRARDVPELASRHRVLSAAYLAREAGLPALRGKLSRWGYDTGASRSFQGQSRRLQVVESRTLRFRSPRGATAFVAFVHAQPDRFFGGAETPRAFASRGRRGLVVEAAACACHLATPVYLAVVVRGARVTWLEINGPRATVRLLRTLAARAP